jgi:hypothetical protein
MLFCFNISHELSIIIFYLNAGREMLRFSSVFVKRLFNTQNKAN